jgi:hypothetical protein
MVNTQEQSLDLSGRRNQGRFRQVVKAVCQVNGRSYQARTYDINQRGMTLLAVPTIPRAHKYLVQCRLPSGTSAIFEVEEKQRKLMDHQDHQFLRLGLTLITESMENLVFFRELARLYQQDPTSKSLDHELIPQTVTGLDRDSNEPRRRLQFSLPAFVKCGNQSIKCETLDLGPKGISLRVPEGFPSQRLFSLTFLEPEGAELNLTVREMNRKDLSGRGMRLGCKVVSGRKALGEFVIKHGIQAN